MAPSGAPGLMHSQSADMANLDITGGVAEPPSAIQRSTSTPPTATHRVRRRSRSLSAAAHGQLGALGYGPESAAQSHPMLAVLRDSYALLTQMARRNVMVASLLARHVNHFLSQVGCGACLLVCLIACLLAYL